MSALALIRDMKDTNYTISLTELLTDKDKKVKVRAANVLGKIGNKTALVSFRKAISEPNISVTFTKALLINIGRLGSQEDIQLIRNYLYHSNPEISIYAAGSLAMLGSIEGEEILFEASLSEDGWIQRISYHGLGLLRTTKSRNRLEEIINDENASWKSYALLAYHIQQFDDNDDKKYIDQLTNLAENNDRVVAKWAIGQLVDLLDIEFS